MDSWPLSSLQSLAFFPGGVVSPSGTPPASPGCNVAVHASQEPSAVTLLLPPVSLSHATCCRHFLVLADDLMPLPHSSHTESMLTNQVGSTEHCSAPPATAPGTGKLSLAAALSGLSSQAFSTLSPPLHPRHKGFQPLRPVALRHHIRVLCHSDLLREKDCLHCYC